MLVAERPLQRGDAAVPPCRPLVLLQSASNRSSVLACAACAAGLGGADGQAALLAGGVTRADAAAAPPPFTSLALPHPLAPPPCLSSVSCAAGCGELYCSDGCAATAAARGHRLLCVGPCEDDTHPLVRFKVRALSSRSPGEADAVLLAASLLAALHCAESDASGALRGDGGGDGGGGGGEAASARVNDLRRLVGAYRTWWELAESEAGVEERRREVAASAALLRDGVADRLGSVCLSSPTAQAGDGVPKGTTGFSDAAFGAALSCARLAGLRTASETPLGAWATGLRGASEVPRADRRRAEGALRALLAAWAGGGGGAAEDGEEEVEAEAEADDEEAEAGAHSHGHIGGDGSDVDDDGDGGGESESDGDGSSSDDADGDDAAAAAAAAASAALPPPTPPPLRCVVLLSSRLGLPSCLPHACAPNARLCFAPSPSPADASASAPAARALAVTLTATTSVRAGDALTVCRLNDGLLRDDDGDGDGGDGDGGDGASAAVRASHPCDARDAALRARRLPTPCACALCALQRNGGSLLLVGPFQALAAAAEACDACGSRLAVRAAAAAWAALFRRLLASPPSSFPSSSASSAPPNDAPPNNDPTNSKTHIITPGFAAHAAGVSLLSANDWAGAHAAWAAGLAACPGDDRLRAIASAAAAFAVPSPLPSHRAHAAAAGADAAVTRISPGRRCALLSAPSLTAAQCEAAIAEAEAAAAARSGGAWATARHVSVPTTDVSLLQLPSTLAAFLSAVATSIAPAAATLFPARVPSAGRLRVHDAFLVRYDAAAGQASLPAHTDQSILSVTLALNNACSSDGGGGFVGGGTLFEGLGEGATPFCPPAGRALLFPGSAPHAGAPITAGRRYIIAAFFWVDVRSAAA